MEYKMLFVRRKAKEKMGSIYFGAAITVTLLVLLLLTETRAQTEGSTTTQSPANRGAARQMYGSGSLRGYQTGSDSGQSTSAEPPTLFDPKQPLQPNTKPKVKEEQPRIYLPRNDNQQQTPAQQQQPPQQEQPPQQQQQQPEKQQPNKTTREGLGILRGEYIQYTDRHGHKSHALPPDFSGPGAAGAGFSLGDFDDSDDEVPSYRNGAPVNGLRQYPGVHSSGRYAGGARGLEAAYSRSGLYSGFDAYESRVDKSQVPKSPDYGHGVGPHGQGSSDANDRNKALVQEDEGDSSDSKLEPTCQPSICKSDQFLCVSTCTCIAMEARCDEHMDCVNADDELDCEGPEFNETCTGKRSVRCPNTGKCIAKQWLCDGDNDCGDYSDESHCGPQKNCTSDQFECRNGLCLSQEWVCDGDNDCKDFSDEEQCDKKKTLCFDSDFVCLDGTCIWDYLRCNGYKDCADGSDELRCDMEEVECRENQFQCENPHCIPLIYKCDGDDDCGDGSDEKDCLSTGETCNTNEYKCESGNCILKKWVCDKEIDCTHGDDERNCNYPKTGNCTKDEFPCFNGVCISREWVCDGVPDCPNGEDEQTCQMSCELTQYMCKPSSNNYTQTGSPTSHWLAKFREHQPECISMKHVCDGEPDCPEKDDEENCPTRVKCSETDKCQQFCIRTSDNKSACACDAGYVLAKDNKTCEDIDECQFQKEPVCSQLCVNTKGSFVCKCKEGYVTRPDLRTCKALGANPSLLLANRIDIRQVRINGPKYTSVLKGLHNAIALDYHYKKGLIYWSDVSMDVIQKVYVNGSHREDFIRWGLESPGGLAIDWIHDLLFWTDSGTKRVEVITLETRIRHVLVSSDLDKPRAIAVHPGYGYVYWTDWGPNPRIERADMDGSSRTPLITENIHWPNGLCIDYTTDRIYWIDAKHLVVESALIGGTNRKKVVSRGLYHPFAITVFEDAIYWTDWHFKSISLANKNTGRGFKTIHSGLHFPMDLHSYHPQRQPDYHNRCGSNNGGCSHMCLPTSMGYSCVCPIGLKINADGKTCASRPDNLLVFARKKDLRIISLDQSAKAFDIVIPVDNVQSAVALTWNSEDDTIFWTDVEDDTISVAKLDGTNRRAVIKHNLESPAGLALDWITKKLYWTDGGTNRIECSNLDGSMRTLLIYEGLDKPRDIALDPYKGIMYWSDWGDSPKIESAWMDGSHRKTIVSTNLTWPNGLALDFEKNRLYWADGGTHKIEYMDLSSKTISRNTIISAAGNETKFHPFGLVVHKNYIYWTDWDTMSINRADKDTGKGITVIKSDLSGLMDVRVFYRDRKTMDNPCKQNNGGCSHLCLLSNNSKRYSCACPTGLMIRSDQKTCPTMPSKFLLMSHRVDVRVLSFDINYTADTVMPYEFMKNVSGADVDLETGLVYWTDPGQIYVKQIRKMTFEGRSAKTVIDGCIDTVDSLVVDTVGRKLYWTDVGLNSIEVSELDGTNRKVLVWSGLDNPRAIALHCPAGLVFWTDWGHNARIERADMDGEHRTAVVTDNLVWPNGLSVDLATDRIYWNDAKMKVIESSDLQGRDRKVVMNAVEHPYGLAVVGDFLYWSDWHEKALLKAKKDDGANRKVVLGNLSGIMDIRYIDQQQVRPENVCDKNNGGCSHLCLKNPNGFSCACPTGILINDDKKTCNSTPMNFLLLATKKTLVRMSLDTPEMWEVPLPVDTDISAQSVDFHWEKQFIFYADVDENLIKRINLRNFTDIKVVVRGDEASSPFRIAVDWLANNVYWTDMKHRMIEVAHTDGSCRMKLIENLREPRSIAVFPSEGYLYWADWADPPSIQRSYLDGSGQKAIVSSDLRLPNGLTVDYSMRNLYWADALKDRIEMSDLHGRYRIALVPEAVNSFGLTLYGNNIYWSWFKNKIEKADKRTGKSRNKIRTVLDGTVDIRAVSAERQIGWSPCGVDNGGCTHMCFFVRKSYKCECPSQADSKPCSKLPQKDVPLRKTGTDSDPYFDDEEEPVLTPKPGVNNNRNRGDGRLNDYNRPGGSTGGGGEGMSLRTMITTTVILLIITVGIIIAIIYLQCPRKNKRDDFLYNNRRNVLTFSNPNYSASSGGEVAGSNNQQPQDKKGFIWKRLKYDKSQERVYEDNDGQASSPEVMSLIPPTTTTTTGQASNSSSSSRPVSMTAPMESSPPAITKVTVQRLEPTKAIGPKPRPLV